MFSQNNACRRREDQPTESVDPTLGLAIAEDDAGFMASTDEDRRWETPHSDDEEVSNFIIGLTIALPLSISLWAFMIWGLKAII